MPATYTLADPDTGGVKNVGRSVHPRRRLIEHASPKDLKMELSRASPRPNSSAPSPRNCPTDRGHYPFMAS
jgi:hypothetical protein